MKLYRSLKISVTSLSLNKLRTFLALVGISIGVAAVIIMAAIGRGTQDRVVSQIEKMGINLLTIKASQVKKIMNREVQFEDVTSLKIRDVEAIVNEVPDITGAAPVQDRDVWVKYGNVAARAKVLGTTPNFKEIRNYSLAGGRFFTQEENRAGLRVVVIGCDIHKTLFKNLNPCGEVIRIGRVPFEVIGVLRPVGASTEGSNEDIQVLIPIHTAMRRVFNINHLKLIYVQAREKESMLRVEQDIRELLRERHNLVRHGKSDDFSIRNQVTVIEAEQEAVDSFTLLIAGIAGISLLVGGIGIFAIMLLAVKERTNEIGLRRAIGARSKDILFQFLIEALLLGLSGGVMGFMTGVLGAWLLRILTALTTVIPINIMLLSILFSLSVGLFFGVYPAQRASRLDPIAALRAK